MKTLHKKLFKEIDEILWKEWDPIGVNEFEDARNEYLDYVTILLDLKIKNTSRKIIAETLHGIEKDYMDLKGDISKCKKVAEKIFKLNIKT